jgi:hypothetical protein
MLLASSHPHDDFSIKGLRGRIKLWPMDLPFHRGVVIEVIVDGRIDVHFRWILWVVGDIGRRLPLMSQSICLELGARLATICCRLGKKTRRLEIIQN